MADGPIGFQFDHPIHLRKIPDHHVMRFIGLALGAVVPRFFLLSVFTWYSNF